MAMASKEDEFRKWLAKVVREKGLLEKNDLINSSAYILNRSPVTTKKYLDKCTSSAGEYMTVRGPNMNESFVTIKGFPYATFYHMNRDGLTFEDGRILALKIINNRYD